MLDISSPVRRINVFDEDDWNRIAVGAELPSGLILVEWLREPFPEAERTEKPVYSQYRPKEDAEQCTGGTVIYEDPN